MSKRNIIGIVRSDVSRWLSILILAACSTAMAEEREALIFDFERDGQNRFENADKLEFVPDHATQGKTSGKTSLEKQFGMFFGFYGGTNLKGRWGEFDQFIIDVFVEGGAVKVGCYSRDKDAKDWWTRYNNEFTLQPGKRSLSWNLGSLNRQNGKGCLDMKELDCFSVWFNSEDPKQPATIYLDNARLVKGAGSFEVNVLFSFEGDDASRAALEDWPEEFKGKSAMEVVEEHASHGKKALRLDSRAPAGNVQFFGFEGDWSRYDALCIDVFLPGENPAPVSGWVRSGDPKADWWNRCNWDRVLRPGFNTLRLSVGELTSPRGTPIDASKIVRFNVAVDRLTIFLDNLRLVKGVEEIAVEGLRKFDFGPPASALMPGFTRVHKQDAYAKERGWGWMSRAEMARDFDLFELLGRHRPPDDLCRDCCMPVRATFAIDLPDGDYRVWLMLAPPGFGWGTNFKHRTVKAEGIVVLDQPYSAESFKAFEYALQDAEDLPGEDLWEKYIRELFQPLLFDAKVADGQLSLEFDSHGQWGWSVMVCGLSLWPQAQDNAAQKWLASLEGRRKDQYHSLHVEKLPDDPTPYAPSEEDKARGYVRFVVSPDREIQVNSVPTPEEAAAKRIEMFASPGEYEDGCFGLWPLKDQGTLKLSVGDLTGPDARLPASSIELMVLRYKALNKTAVYVPSPKYLDRVLDSGIPIRPNVTRSFWLAVHVPQDAKAGTYGGQVKMEWSDGRRDAVDVSLTVWPIELAEPDFPMGMFMMGTQGAYTALDETREAYWKEWQDVLADARAHGITSVDPMVSIPLRKIADGKAEIDFAAMDRFMGLAKTAGFRQELCGYSIDTGFRIKMPVDHAAEAKRFGVADYGALVKTYFDAVREHAKEKGWLPVAFCTDDEYIVHPGSAPEKLAEHHRILQDNAPGFRFVTFDSVYLRKDEGFAEACDKMLADIDTWGAGVHTPREAEVIRKAGRRLWLYNTGMNRFTFGAYMFFARKKHDVKGFFQWVYSGGGTYGNFYLASHVEAHYGVVYPSDRGLRTTPIWERIRAGCDDHRYLETAWGIMEKAKAAGKAEAQVKALESLLESTFRKLTFGKPRADAYAGEGRADNPMTPEGMNAFRKTVAEEIIALQEAVK